MDIEELIGVSAGKVCFRNFEQYDYDILINTTSVGMLPNIENSPISAHLIRKYKIMFDVIYNPLKTKLLNDAQTAGRDIVIISGIEMFIQQAAHAFKLWTNEEMPVDDVREYVVNLDIIRQ